MEAIPSATDFSPLLFSFAFAGYIYYMLEVFHFNHPSVRLFVYYDCYSLSLTHSWRQLGSSSSMVLLSMSKWWNSATLMRIPNLYLSC